MAELYKIERGNKHTKLQIDHNKPPKQWLHPADRTITTDTDITQGDPTRINIYTEGSKSEQGVGAGIVILRSGSPTVKLMCRLDTSCTNNQAEAFAILKALEHVKQIWKTKNTK